MCLRLRHFSKLLNKIILGSSLECYVCTSQNGNTEKCLRTIRTCEPGEDYCLTTIAWGSKYLCILYFLLISHLHLLIGYPYWTASADKQYYVSKQCATKELCERTWNETLPYCERIWYLDWRCSECCQGDRCNYFVTVCLFKNHWNVISYLLWFRFSVGCICSEV